MPQTSMDVIKGQMLVLRASYNTDPGVDLSTNTVLWNFVSNNTQLVRRRLGDASNIYTCPLPSVAIICGITVMKDVCLFLYC